MQLRPTKAAALDCEEPNASEILYSRRRAKYEWKSSHLHLHRLDVAVIENTDPQDEDQDSPQP